VAVVLLLEDPVPKCDIPWTKAPRTRDTLPYISREIATIGSKWLSKQNKANDDDSDHGNVFTLKWKCRRIEQLQGQA
jgi:hypothetical protein